MLVGVIIQGITSDIFTILSRLTTFSVVPGVTQSSFIGGRFLVGFGSVNATHC